jgi:hypothetical protein
MARERAEGSSRHGWTPLEYVAAGVALVGTLPFAYLASSLAIHPVGAVASSLGSWDGAVVFGALAVVGWSLLLWARRSGPRITPTSAAADHPE